MEEEFDESLFTKDELKTIHKIVSLIFRYNSKHCK